jgi:hypothetical protein
MAMAEVSSLTDSAANNIKKQQSLLFFPLFLASFFLFRYLILIAGQSVNVYVNKQNPVY